MDKPSSSSDDNTLAAEVHEVLDATGLLCPEPVMMLHNVIKRLPEGGLVKILATDSSTLRDIPRFCEHLKHSLLFSPDSAHPLAANAKKTEQEVGAKKLALDDGLEKKVLVYWVRKRIE